MKKAETEEQLEILQAFVHDTLMPMFKTMQQDIKDNMHNHALMNNEIKLLKNIIRLDQIQIDALKVKVNEKAN